MAAPSIDFALTAIDIMNGGANTFSTPSLESASTPSSYRDDQQGTGWEQVAGVTGLYGARVALATASSDFTAGQYIWFQLAYESSNMLAFVDTLANGGIRVLFVDSAGSWVRYNIFGSDTYVSTTTKGGFRSFSNLGTTNTADSSPVWTIDRNRTPDASSGTIDWTDIDDVELHINIASSKLMDIFMGRIGVADRPVLTAGEVGDLCSIDLFPQNQDNWPNDGDNPRLFSKSEANHAGANTTIYAVMYGYEIGDGTTLTKYSDNRAELAFYPSRDAQEASPAGIEGYGAAFNGNDTTGHDRKLVINQSATDEVSFTESTFSGVDYAGGEYSVEVTGSTSGTCTFSLHSFYRAYQITCSHATFTDCLFHDVETVNISADTTLTGGTYRSSGSTATGLTFTGIAADYSAITCEIKASNTGNDLTMGSGGAGTYTLTGITVESGHTLKIRNDSATNAITVAIGPGITYSTSTAGGTIAVTQPTDDFTLTSDVAGSTIRIFTTGTQTVLDSTTGTSLVYTHSGQTVDYEVGKAGYYWQRVTGKVLSGTETVAVTLVAEPFYNSGHSLTYTTDASHTRATNKLNIPTFAPTGQDVWSLMSEEWATNSALYNTEFPYQLNGSGSLFLRNDCEGATDADIENLTGCGVRYVSAAGVTTASWVGVKSVGTATGFTGEYQQVDGSGTVDARATGVFDELIKMYGDASHGNFDYRGHLVLKFQPNGYREARSDVLADYGISTLDPALYIVAMEPVALVAAAGDPALTITVTDHGASPVTWNAKDFSITVTDNASPSTGEAILRELNYNLSLDATYQGKDPFNWPEMVKELGSDYDTLRGVTEGGVGAALKGVRVVQNDGTTAHSDFTRFMADDGTFYTVPVTATASITSIVTGSRVRIYNNTTATETYNGIPGTSYSQNYTEGTTYTSGDNITVTITQTSGVTAQSEYSATVISTSTGWSVLAAQVSDDVYDAIGIDGSTITKFTADYVNDEVDLTTATNFTIAEWYAWWCYNNTTSQGIAEFFGGVTAIDQANFRVNVSILDMYWNNNTATNVYQTDNRRFYRSDDAYPVNNPTTGGGGIDIVWKSTILIASTGGSALTAAEKTQLTNIESKTAPLTATVSNQIDVNIKSVADTAVTGVGTVGDPWGP